jgi:serine/threonine-protein kinase
MGSIREGAVVAGKYQIERPLTRGGMGSIWVARHLKLDMPVAVKLMAPALAETAEGRARFEREARAAALIQSPNVAQIHDYGVEDGTPYIVMELLAGEDLGARLHRVRRLSIHAVAAMFGQLAKGLRRAHDVGIVHRDLKPANIFLAGGGDDDEIVNVLDFGIAKLTGAGQAEDATATGLVLGSIHYMSPEQARGVRELDHRSDLWSLGVIAFRAIVGRLPFPGAQMGDVILKICSEAIPRPSDLAPDLGPDVDAFFARALARDPDARWQTARELAAALAQLAALTPAATPPPAPPSLPIAAPASRRYATPAYATPAPVLGLDLRAAAPPSPTSSHAAPNDPSWLTPQVPGTLGSAHVRSLAPPPDAGAPCAFRSSPPGRSWRCSRAPSWRSGSAARARPPRRSPRRPRSRPRAPSRRQRQRRRSPPSPRHRSPRPPRAPAPAPRPRRPRAPRRSLDCQSRPARRRSIALSASDGLERDWHAQKLPITSRPAVPGPACGTR